MKRKGEKNQNYFKVFVDFLKKMRIITFCMDTKKECMIPECGDLSELRKNKMVVGAKQLRKALDKGTAKFVCLAKNADPGITEPMEIRCNELSIPVFWVGSMQELGSACGIDVGAAAAAAVE